MLFYYFKRFMIIVSLFIMPLLIQAAVILEGSETLEGPHFVLKATSGQQVGPNLFYRFQSLNLESTESITFMDSEEIETLIILVTEEQSNIDGLLKSEISNANLYFLNPKGITFGPHAKIEVPASLSISTAAYLKLDDGNLFNATTPNTLLTGSSPNAFGFLETPAPILIEDSQLVFGEIQKSTDEQVPTLAWIAGDITLKNGTLSISNQNIKLISLAASGEISVDKTDFTGLFGSIQLENTKILTLTEDNAGYIGIVTNRLSLVEDSLISNFGANGRVGINAKGEVQLKNSIISTTNEGQNNTGNLTLASNKLQMQNSSIQTLNKDNGKAGNITILIDQLSLVEDSSISSFGANGRVGINAKGEVQLKNSIISTINEGQGNTGSIKLSLNKLQMQNSSIQIISTTNEGQGNTGSIELRLNKLQMQNSSIQTLNKDNGKAGDISLLTNQLSLVEESLISSFGANGLVSVIGEIQFKNSIISTISEGQGNTGDIQLWSLNKLWMQNSSIQTLSTLAGGGDITVMTSNPLYLIDSEITTRIEGENSTGGNITIGTIEKPKFMVLDGGHIIAHVQGGSGGNVRINTNMIYSNCLTLTPELNANFHISCVEVSETQYQGEFTLIDMDNFIFELNPTTLKEANIEENASFTDCGSFSDNVMHLHCVRIDDTFWWADLEWINQNPIQFQLTEQFGLLE